MLAGQVRLYSGLTLFVFVLCHFMNHAFGLHSIAAMEDAHAYLLDPWRSTAGTVLLGTAMTLHALMALRSVYLRRSLRMPPWEMAQLVLGLTIPFLLAEHVMGTRVAELTLGAKPSYEPVLFVFWVGAPELGITQAAATLVVWIHACIGLHYWLRTKSGYERWRRPLGLVAVVIPTLALSGFTAAGIEIQNMSMTPDYVMGLMGEAGITREVIQATATRTRWSWGIIAALIALPFAARAIRDLINHLKPHPFLMLPDGRKFKVTPGASALEVLRANGVPHASVCGGRGRCTTCRVRVVTGGDGLEPPDAVESQALDRIHATEGMRLACQIHPTDDVGIAPLLPPNATAKEGRRPGGLEGREMHVATMFVDLRGSTKLGEAKLPYDVLFILNQFFAEMTIALEETHGHYAQFNGDGLMALYGINGETDRQAVRNAIDGTRVMLTRLDNLNDHLASELREPLRIGIGLHYGEAIVGAMGPPANQLTTAIGDTINTAARLESLTKEYGVPLIVSEAAADAAGIELPENCRHEVTVRGRDLPVRFYALDKVPTT